MSGTKAFERLLALIVGATLPLTACEDAGADRRDPLSEGPVLTLCRDASGCEEVSQPTAVLKAGERRELQFTCPAGQAFLHDWDAVLDEAVSVHVFRQHVDGLTVRARNPAEAPGGFTVILGCSDREYDGAPHHKTLILPTPVPEAAQP